MKKISRRIWSILLAFVLLVMSVHLSGFAVSSADRELASSGEASVYYIETYEQLRNHAGKAQEGYIYILNNDIFQQDNENNMEVVIPSGACFNLDLNGYNIYRGTQGNDCALFRIESDAAMVINDTSAAQTGGCTFSEGYADYYKAVFYNEGGELEINGGYYQMLSTVDQGVCSVVRTTSGYTCIRGGTFDSSASWGGDTISVGHNAYVYDFPRVFIVDGVFYGKYQSIDVTPMNNYLKYGNEYPNGSLFPSVYVLGGDFYVTNGGKDGDDASFAYCNNGWGRVIVADGTVLSTCLNARDQMFLSGASKKYVTHTIDDYTDGYYEVTAPPVIMSESLDYYYRLTNLCLKEEVRSYKDFYYAQQYHGDEFEAILEQIDTIYVTAEEKTSPYIELYNRTSDHQYINWYMCDESDYQGEDTQWTHIGDAYNLSHWKIDERPEEGGSYIIRCVVTKSDLSTYEDVVKIYYEPLEKEPDPTVVSCVDIIDIKAPAVGSNPVFDATPVGDAFYISGVFWTDVTNSTAVAMHEDDTFVAGHTYKLEVWIKANEDYKFCTDEDGYIDIIALVGGKQADVLMPGSEISAELEVRYTVSASTLVSFVDVMYVDAPLEGNTPDMDAFCTTTGCNVAKVEWYDKTEGRGVLLSEDDTFVAGRKYLVVVTVEAEGNYTYELDSDNINVAYGDINGQDAIAYSTYSDKVLELGYEFAPCEENPDKPTNPTETTSPTEETEPTGTDASTNSTDSTEPSVIGILGDANCDGIVNVKDATAIQKHLASLMILTDTGLVLADVDESCVVNIKDATSIQKYVAGMDTGLSIGEAV